MSKLQDIAKKHIVTLIVGAIAVISPFVKDVFITGTKVKTKEAFISMLKSKEGREFIYLVSDSAINVTMNDPMTWNFVFDNDLFNGYVDNKTVEFTGRMDLQIEQVYKSMFNKVDSVAKDVGIRTDELIPLVTQMAKAFKRGDFEVRFVRADF